MADELVLGLGMDPRAVAAMTENEVRYWYDAAIARQRRDEQRRGGR